MSPFYVLTLVLVVWGFLVFLERRDARAQSERDAARRERQTLLQRIQAPELATHEHATKDVAPEYPSVGWDDDDAYWESKGYQPEAAD